MNDVQKLNEEIAFLRSLIEAQQKTIQDLSQKMNLPVVQPIYIPYQPQNTWHYGYPYQPYSYPHYGAGGTGPMGGLGGNGTIQCAANSGNMSGSGLALVGTAK